MSLYARRVYATTLLMVTGFTFLSRLTQIAPPSTRFVFLGAGVRLGLPSHPASRRRSCLRLGVSTTSSSRGLSPPIDRPCRAYSRAAFGRCARSPGRSGPRCAAGGRPGGDARQRPDDRGRKSSSHRAFVHFSEAAGVRPGRLSPRPILSTVDGQGDDASAQPARSR